MSQSRLSDALKEALAIHRDGFPTRAIPLYERALAASPDDADALSAYGLALVEAGRPTEAEKPLKRAIEREPGRPGYHLNLAELYFKVGEPEMAIAEIKATTERHPAFAPAFRRLGKAHVDRQDLHAATDALDRALQLDPQDRETALLLARALAAVQNFGAAYYVLDHMDKIDANDLEAIRLRLEIARARRDFQAMDALAGRLTTLAPEDPQGWRDVATVHFENGRYVDALTALDRALAIEPRTAERLSQYASIAINALDFAKADAALTEAESLSPLNTQMLSTKALLLTYQGRSEEAEAYCRRCFDINPDFVGVYPQLSLLRKGWLSDEEERHIRGFSARADIAPGPRAIAAFVVAHSRDARGEVDAAFADYVNANALAAERNRNDEIKYDFPGHAGWTDAIIQVFPDAGDHGVASYHEGAQPIFVVGLPRCGSTLVESVISAHSSVDAGGEMSMMPNIFNRWFRDNYRAGVANIPDAGRAIIAGAYMKGIPARFTKQRFTDKNLLNIEAAGLIAQIFPSAKIINVRRNPVENGLSIWRQDMLKFWSWTMSFEDIARRYGLYAKLVDHFERSLPGRFHTVQYEDFVTGFDAGARRLISLCDLDWEDGCLKFQEARAIAPTISAVQVREEVGLKGDRANTYGARLDPLRRALEASGVDLATGALRK